jgi:hypothetical protein
LGHIHLGVLPGTAKWRDVVGLLDAHAPDENVIAASAHAAEKDFANAVRDPTFVEAIRLLALIPQAARSDQFGRQLRDLGLDVPDDPHLIDIVAGSGRALERTMVTHGARSDFSEIVRRALLGTLSVRIGDELPGLLAADSSDVRNATARMARPGDFSHAARTFFGRLVADTLSSWLDRTLSTHVGPGRRFQHLGERTAFDTALGQYCSEATRIIREFSGGWYSKTLYRDGTITSPRAAAYGAVAFKKITEELQHKRGADD